MPRCIERNWRILFVPLNFINVGMPRWFFYLECNSRLCVPHFKAFPIKSCHRRILRLLQTLTFFWIHTTLTQEKNCTMSAQTLISKSKPFSLSSLSPISIVYGWRMQFIAAIDFDRPICFKGSFFILRCLCCYCSEKLIFLLSFEFFCVFRVRRGLIPTWEISMNPLENVS